MPLRSLRTWTAVAAALALCACQRAQPGAAAPTFAGETVRIIVGFAAGGTYDLHARLVARHLGRHLPGTPTVIVENMPGGGGMVAANYLSTVAAADGNTLAELAEANAADVVVNAEILHQLQFLGSPAPTTTVLVFAKRTGIATLDDWRRATKPPRFASSGSRAFTAVVPRVTAAAFGLPVAMVSGYAGSAEMRLALEGGEVDAICLTWDSLKTVLGTLSNVNVVLRFSATPFPGIGAPDAMTLASDPGARELLDTGVYKMAPLGRFFAVRRGIPEARLRLLREGLARTWADAEFLADAKTAGLTIEPATADTLEQSVQTLLQHQPVITRIESILSEH